MGNAVYVLTLACILKGRAICCRFYLCCFRKDDFRKGLFDKSNAAKRFGIRLKNTFGVMAILVKKNIAMLTLKALTVLYMASAVSSLYFLSVYYGDIDVYANMLDALRFDLDWYPSINFALNVDFDFVFAWPTDLRVEFQLPMFFFVFAGIVRASDCRVVAFERLHETF